MCWTIHVILASVYNRKLQKVVVELMPAAFLPLALALNGLLVLQLHN